MKTRTRLITAAATATLLAGTLAGCGAFHPQDFPKNGPTAKATSNPQPVASGDFGHAWPLTVASGAVG